MVHTLISGKGGKPTSATVRNVRSGGEESHLLLGLLSGLGNLTTLPISLLDAFDDTDGDGLSHVTDGESSQRRVFGERLDTHGLGGDHLDHGGISRLDELGGGFNGLSGSSVDLLLQLGELYDHDVEYPINLRPRCDQSLNRKIKLTLQAMWAVWQSKTGAYPAPI
jgi:hypothetical protein